MSKYTIRGMVVKMTISSERSRASSRFSENDYCRVSMSSHVNHWRALSKLRRYILNYVKYHGSQFWLHQFLVQYQLEITIL